MATREEIAAALKGIGVDFPETASLTQLRNLLKQTVGEASAVPAEKDGAENANIVRNSIETDAFGENACTCDVAAAESFQNGASVCVNTIEMQETNMSADLDQIEAQLAQRLRIMKLKNEVALLETQSLNKVSFNFSDIEAALPKFSGDNSYNVTKWISDFEYITHGCDDNSKLIFCRRMISGSAKLFVRLLSVQNWNGLKSALITEFNKEQNIRDVYKKLESRIWKPNSESLHYYVLIMQEIASGSNISERDLIEYIVDGLCDKTSASVMFYNATSIAELKKLLPKYEKLRVKPDKPGKTNVERKDVRCFNCSGMGHFSNECTKEKRKRGSCFKCGSMEHQYAKCPLKTVAALDTKEDLDYVNYLEESE